MARTVNDGYPTPVWNRACFPTNVTMMPTAEAPNPREAGMYYRMILLLSIVGGGVDAIMIVGFGVLTAAQTGNTILMVVALAEGRLATGIYAGISVVGYITGTILGELVLLGCKLGPWISPVCQAFLAELVALVCLLVCWHLVANKPGTTVIAALVVLAAVAMGIQSAAVVNLHVGHTTTYVTGNLTSFGTGIARALPLIKSAAHSFPKPHDSNFPILISRYGPALYGLDWLAYFGGALASAVLFLRFHQTALVLPIVVLAAVIIASERAQRRVGNLKHRSTGDQQRD